MAIPPGLKLLWTSFAHHEVNAFKHTIPWDPVGVSLVAVIAGVDLDVDNVAVVPSQGDDVDFGLLWLH